MEHATESGVVKIQDKDMRQSLNVDELVEQKDQFLHASMQLVQQQCDTRHKVRSLWYLVQRLRWDNHIDTTAMDLLRTDLLQIIRGLTLEKQDGAKIYKSGTLVWNQYNHTSSNSSDFVPHKVWCVLHEDHGRLDITVLKDGLGQDSNDSFGLSKISSHIAWLIDGDQTSTKSEHFSVFGTRIRPKVNSLVIFEVEIPFDQAPSRVLSFEAPTEEIRDEWVRALNTISRSDLVALQRRIHTIDSAVDYRQTLLEVLPLTVPLTWQKHRIEKEEKLAGLSRRDSKNLSMLQVVKDIERDRYDVDGMLLATSDDVIQQLLATVITFLQTNQPQDEEISALSPASRLTRSSEAKALSFVERVLRGSSRTQSGGDVYDALSLICTNTNLTVCPLSHDVLPVTLLSEVDDNTNHLHVHMCVRMQFKVLHASDSITNWAILEGTLERTFTYGRIADPGYVVVQQASMTDESSL